MEPPQDFLAHRHTPDRRLSRRSLLGTSAAVTFAAAAGLFTAWTARDDASRGRVLFDDTFAGHSLSRNHWNPYICDSNSDARPWLTQPNVAVASSAIGAEDGLNAAYDLPPAVLVDDGLTLMSYRGTAAAGYSWTVLVICSLPTSNDFGSGTVRTAGFTFADARVEVQAKMPDVTSGQWPAIWFLPIRDDRGAEIDLFEGGFVAKTINPNQVMAVKLGSGGNQQQFVDCRTGCVHSQGVYGVVWSTLMRILLLAQFFPPDIGGEERHVFNLANTLAKRGHEVAVATQRMVDVPDQETLVSGVRVHRFATVAMRLPGVYSTGRAHHPPLPDPLGVRELARITRQEQPQVVHAHNWIANSAVALRRSSPAGPRFGLVLTLHDFSHVCATKRLMRMGSACEGPTIARCLPCATVHYGPAVGPLTAAATALMRPWKNRAIDHIVCVSNAVASRNHIPLGPNASVIPNFVLDEVVLGCEGDVAESRTEGILPGLPKEDFLLFVGELSRDKGLPTLLRAYESLGRKRPPLLLVGRRMPDTPAHLPEGAEMCTEWPHNHVMAAFRRCLFSVLPSICLDACPTTVLEAMASGRPVVATTTGGIVDMIADGESGLLVAPGDEYKLAEAMARLLNDTDLRIRLAAGAQERVLRFTASAVAERLEAVYAQVAPRASAASANLSSGVGE